MIKSSNPHSTLDAFAPSPINDSPAAVKIASPHHSSLNKKRTNAIWEDMIDDMQFSSTHFLRQIHIQKIKLSWLDLAIRTYQGNQDIDIPIITLLRDGPRTEVIISGNIRRKGKKPIHDSHQNLISFLLDALKHSNGNTNENR